MRTIIDSLIRRPTEQLFDSLEAKYGAGLAGAVEALANDPDVHEALEAAGPSPQAAASVFRLLWHFTDRRTYFPTREAMESLNSQTLPQGSPEPPAPAFALHLPEGSDVWIQDARTDEKMAAEALLVLADRDAAVPSFQVLAAGLKGKGPDRRVALVWSRLEVDSCDLQDSIERWAGRSEAANQHRHRADQRVIFTLLVKMLLGLQTLHLRQASMPFRSLHRRRQMTPSELRRKKRFGCRISVAPLSPATAGS